MAEQGKEMNKMFEETVKNLAMLDRDSVLMINAATTALLMKRQAEEMTRKDIPAAQEGDVREDGKGTNRTFGKAGW